MSKTLLVLFHPNFKNSFANKILVDKIKAKIPDIEIDNIHELYPDLKIDVKAEQEKLLKANTIILAFPMFWFNCFTFYLNGLRMFLIMDSLMELMLINQKEKK